MRLIPVILTAAVVGGGVGVATTFVGQPAIETRFAPPLLEGAPGIEDGSSGPRAGIPQAEAGELSYDFGTMQRGATASHEFTITNVGDAPLLLEVGPTTCKCTIGEVADKPLQPGDSTPVRVEWIAKTGAGRFEQTATVLTRNDPRRKRIEFKVFGNVVDSSMLSPQDFNLGQFTTAEERKASVYLATFDDRPLEATVKVLSDKAVGHLYEIDVEPVSLDQIPITGAKSGVRIDLTASPGLPAGRLFEWVEIKTNLETVGSLQVPIHGQVSGDLSIHGRGWVQDAGVLNFGSVRAADGNESKLFLSFKGEAAAGARASLESADPDWIEVELGEPEKIREGRTHQPMTVRIPPGRPAMIRTNSGQGEGDARIRLRTNLDTTPQVDMRVRFIIAE